MNESRSKSEHETSFAETALALGGKSSEESQSTGKIDRADDRAERMFRSEYQTRNSPAHRAVWDRVFPGEMFQVRADSLNETQAAAVNKILALTERRKREGTLYDDSGKTSSDAIAELAGCGFWGLLIDPQYGGLGLSFRDFSALLTRLAAVEPTIAGLASVHGCIGAVDPLQAFGTEQQRSARLPLLASGERLSAFALTEPGAGSDLTALRTRAVRSGNDFLITGEKLFITHARLGGMIGLVAMLEEKPAVFTIDLPLKEDDSFSIVKYGLHALRHTENVGLRFRDFRVPGDSLLTSPQGDGLAIAYHGLNKGRTALCANAAGTMRILLASMREWAAYRRTYGLPIAQRELVKRRLARAASLIVGCDALTAWCSSLLDAGYRGEMECILAKVFAAESLKETAVELALKTHGGRSFLHGHVVGDHLHDYLAPSIYEGEGEILSLAFFKALVKKHGTEFFEPLGKAMAKAGIQRPHPLNPLHAWKLRKELVPYVRWTICEKLVSKSQIALPKSLPFSAHAAASARSLQAMPLEISAIMRKHGLKLADRQCRMIELSQRVQKLLTISAVSAYCDTASNELVRAAGDLLCRDLIRETSFREKTDGDFRHAALLGEQIMQSGFPGCEQIVPAPILRKYD